MLRSLALITPWPPQRTGIADYALDLATGLSDQAIKLDVYTTSTNHPAPPVNITVRPLDQFPGSKHYDHTVYQMGNCSDFHAEMLPVLFEHPGIVHLHDLTLHHLIAFFLYRGDARDYYRVLQYWYGADTAKRVKERNRTGNPYFWDSPSVSDVPFFDPVLQAATGCIVHSQYARRYVLQRFAELPTAVVPQVYRNMTPAPQIPTSEILQIGVFGIVQKHKHIDLLLQAVAECKAQQIQVHLHIGGELDRGCEALPDLAESLGLSEQVTFYGRMEETSFISLMRQIDLCVSLRYPTMGETSAVVSRAVQLGLPTIVNDIGWYAELPECVRKLPVEPVRLKHELVKLFLGYSQDRAQLHSWALKCRALAANTYSFKNVCSSYIELLSAFDKVDDQRLPFVKPRAA